MTTQAADIENIIAAKANPAKFIRQGRGYIDWQFSQVALYLGYDSAKEYVATVKRWHDYDKNYTDCRLITTHTRFLEAAHSHNISP